MFVTRISQYSGIEHTLDLDITQEQLDKFNNGLLVQKAFPQLDADEREFILTGITCEEWEIISGTMESEESNFDN